MITVKSYIAGRWCSGDAEPRPLYDPSTEEVLGEIRSGGFEPAEALRHAREVGGPALREKGFAGRAAMLKALAAAIHEHRDELLDLAASNGGNTRGDGKFDIDGATGTLAYYAALGKELGDGNLLADGDGVQLGRTPRFWGQHILTPRRGVAVHINAFNFPAWGMGEKMACAILAGVPVIEKAGTPSALLAFRLAELAVASGALPEGAFQFVAGSVGDLLDRLGPQDCLAFTGSAATGFELKRNDNLLRHNVRVNLEADSINAAVLGPDATPDSECFELALANVLVDMTQKAGQKCTAVRRILVPAEHVETFAGALRERLEAVVVGDPREPETRMGPLASAGQLADVRQGMGRLAEVAELVTGGPEPIRDRGYFVAPTLLVARDPETPVLHELEVFGPCATVLPYDGTAAEAARLCNRGGGSLVASLYSDDRAFCEATVAAIAPWHGRVWIGGEKVAGQSLGPGAVLPQTIHGGPGRAGGGEELGGRFGLHLYLQRTAVQGYQGLLTRAFGGGA